MKDGLIAIGAASVPVAVADPDSNAKTLIAAIHEADAAGENLLLLPELALTGYTCSDLFFSETLLRSAREALTQIVKATQGLYPCVVLGVPLRVDGRLYNCAAVVADGSILGVVPKTHLPNYGEFYEMRQFASAAELNGEIRELALCDQRVPFGTGLVFCHETLQDYTFGVEICEDLWVASPPSEALALSGANIILNPSASDELIGKAAYRRELICATSAREICAYIYASSAPSESTQDMVFSGHLLACENGSLIAESRPLAETARIHTEIDLGRLTHDRHQNCGFHTQACARRIPFAQALLKTALTRMPAQNPFVPSDPNTVRERTETILAIQSCGLKKRLEHIHAKSAVIGISGGLDSTLALLVAIRAMDMLHRPHSDVLAVTMPCFGTTQRTKSNAVKLCEACGVTLREVDITLAVQQHFRDIGHDPSVTDVTYENSQARERTQILMDVANQSGGLVIGTGDLSELALGWATYNGDHMSMYAVNVSVPKTLVRHIIHYAAEQSAPALKAVLDDILATPVSPELLPTTAGGEISQFTEDLVGPYELHDFFLYYHLRFGFGPAKILRLARAAFGDEYDVATIRKWLEAFIRRFFAQQFKRSCLPDGPKVGSVSLSPRGDWRMPTDAVCALWLKELAAAEI